MNNEKIEQCKADIAKLQEELERLKAVPKPRHGDIVDFHGNLRITVIAENNCPCVYDANGELTCGAVSGNIVAEMYANGNYTAIGNVFDLGGK